jgi:hypothetical protein
MNLRVPQNAENFLTSWGTVSFSRRTLLHGVGYFHTAVKLLCNKKISPRKSALLQKMVYNQQMS